MAQVVYNSKQVKWVGRGYLDAKMQPVQTVADLPSDITEVFDGMTVVVLNDGSGQPHDYWRVNGQWVKKETGGGSAALSFEIVDVLPSEDISLSTIYLKRVDPDSLDNKYDEYVYVNGAWECLGRTNVDLSEYPTKDEMQEAIDEAVVAITEESDAKYATKDELANIESDIVTAATAAVEEELDGKYVKQEDLADVVTAVTEAVEEQIGDDYISRDDLADVEAEIISAATEAVEEKLDDYATKDDLDGVKDDAVSAATAAVEGLLEEKQDKFTAGAGLEFNGDQLNVLVDGQTIIVDPTTNKLHVLADQSGGTIAYIAGEYIKIENDVISVTGITPDEYATKDEVAEEIADAVSSAVTELDLVTKDAVEDMIEESEADTETSILNAKDEAVSESKNYTDAKLVEKQDKLTAGEGIIIENNVISAEGVDLSDYATKEEVSSALTEAIDYVDNKDFATKDDLTGATEEVVTDVLSSVTEYIEAQDFAKEDDINEVAEEISALSESKQDKLVAGDHISIDGNEISAYGFPTIEDVNSAITEYAAENELATKSDVEEAISDYAEDNSLVTAEDLSSAKTEATNAALIASTAWTTNQGYAKEEDVIDTVADLVESIDGEAEAREAEDHSLSERISDEVSARTVADEVMAQMLEVETIEREEADADLLDRINSITHPEYTVSSVTPSSNQYLATYKMLKDGNPIQGSDDINIPKSIPAELTNDIVTDIAVGHVSAGTRFVAGTSLETILRSIFVGETSSTVTYAYYGCLDWDTMFVDPADMTGTSIMPYVTNTESAASTTPFRFMVPDDTYQILVAVPSTFIIRKAQDIDNNIPYKDVFDTKSITINDVAYTLYYASFDAPCAEFEMEITLQNA